MPTSVISGGAGFLGSHLCDLLLAKGHDVLAVDSLLTGSTANLETARANPRFRFLRHDVTKPLHVEEKVDYVWHFASPASPPDYLKEPIHTMKVNAMGTHNLLGLALRHRARFFLASTSEVYGDPLVSPQPEEYWGNVNPVGPRGVYDEAKRYAEALTLAYQRSHGLQTRIIRIFNTYGPRMRLDDGRVVPNFIGQALRGEPLTVYGDGRQTRSFCYYADEIEGIYRLMMSDYALPMNVGNPHEITILQFAEAIQRVAGRKLDIVFRDLPKDDPRQRCPDITKARTILGWEPKVGLDEGLRETLRYFERAHR